jgi:hypothetical protein
VRSIRRVVVGLLCALLRVVGNNDRSSVAEPVSVYLASQVDPSVADDLLDDTAEFPVVVPREEEKRHLARWRVYVGPSLKCEQEPPVDVDMEYDVLGALWACDHVAWCGLLGFIESDLHYRENQ